MPENPPGGGGPATGAHFASTPWSLVARARSPGEGREALDALCRAYWYPVYAFVRRRTGTAEDAQDLTQAFFAHLLEKDVLAAADPSRGKFRTFLLACCSNFLANQRDAARALKRGGGRAPLPFDFPGADRRYAREPADPVTPEALFDRAWALTLLETTFALLEREYAEAGKADLYRLLRPSLAADPEAPTYAAAAASLGTTEAAVKKAAQRMRARYGELLRRQVADTLEDAGQVDDELRALFTAVAP